MQLNRFWKWAGVRAGRKSAQGMGLQRPKARIGEGSVLESKFFFEIGFLLIELYLFGFTLLGK